MPIRVPSRRAGGVTLEVETHGPPDGPMALLLHGFPECAHSWSRQVGPLADAGWFCVVPDQRGYGRSDKPSAVSAYDLRDLVADALDLVSHFGRQRAHVVAHDWGGMVAWWAALEHPDRVATLSALNIPHPRVFAKHLRTPGQLAKSWYMFAFQLPWLPERLLAADDRLVRVMFANTVTKPYTEADLAAYRAAWAAPGALRGMLNWYRNAGRHPLRLPSQRRVTRPTLVLFGKEDKALDWRMAEASAQECDDATLVLLEGAGHFVHHDRPADVNRELLAFLDRHRGLDGTRGPPASAR